MAATASPKAQGAPQAAAQKKPFGILWIAITFMLVVIFSLPTVILLFFGMMPTLVAYIIDRTPQRYSAYCVGGFNFAGVFPYLMKLWLGSHEISFAFGIVTNVFTLLVMYGTAEFGWMVLVGVPPVVGAFLEVVSQRRVAELIEIQKKLIAEWGPEVSASQMPASVLTEPARPPEPARPMAPPVR